MQLTQTIPDAYAPRVITANAVVMGYPEQVPGPDGATLIPNPQSKAVFVNQQIKAMLIKNTKQYEADLARQEKIAQLDSELG